ncbi:hypothetical protein J5N97_008122 [Dioscorea zingiberensis]|uniref:SURP and G-patch domain-containing protein 1-like protein n=1 Tax=Dioscorea zingiberensis TaxID=325984 RepID=A0A9D5DD92_9LILI|nr:hypothetical protein J5N97_008122 [Dioscorea zingiberensis]
MSHAQLSNTQSTQVLRSRFRFLGKHFLGRGRHRSANQAKLVWKLQKAQFLHSKEKMEKKVDPSLFVNDGSFLEKFKQLQQEQLDQLAKEPKNNASTTIPGPAKSGLVMNKRPLDVKVTESKKPNNPASNGKLAFSLKQKSKIAVAPVKLGGDEEEEGGESLGVGASEEPAKRPKLDEADACESSTQPKDVAPSIPSDPAVKKVADKLASFVAKNGRQFEHTTRQRNPGDTPFKFLFDSSCMDYKYYEQRLLEEERILAQAKDSNSSRIANAATSTPRTSNSLRNPVQQHSNYQTPASALYECNNESVSSISSAGRSSTYGESSGPPATDPIAMMEFYMKKAAQEERKRQPRQSKDEMPPPASLQAPLKKGHHMGDYIPQEELEKFMASCNDVAAQKAAKEAAERARIQADNVGHRLLSKMGWKEGEGLGSDRNGRADPVMAGNVRLNNLGIGAQQPGEVTEEDDIYEQYKKRMMLGYRYRPNPLGNPRKAYY